MIVRSGTSPAVRRLVAYVANQPGAIRIGGSMAGRTQAELVAEIELVAARRPGRLHKVRHLAVRLLPDEHLVDRDWCAVAERLLAAMGHARCPSVIYRHADNAHGHLHALAGLVPYSGKALRRPDPKQLFVSVKEQIERDYGLRPVVFSGVAGISVRESRHASAPGLPPPRRRLQTAVAAAARAATGFAGYLAELERRGIEPLPRLDADGSVHAIAYRIGGYLYNDHGLGPIFRWHEIERCRGWRFDPTRDLPLALAARDRFRARHGSTEAPRAAARRAQPPPPTARASTGARAPAPAPGAAAGTAVEPSTAMSIAARHLEALGAGPFDLLVLDAATGRTRELRLECPRDLLFEHLPRLAAAAAGAELLLRPAPGAALLLLPRVAAWRVQAARRQGLAAAVVAPSDDPEAPREVWLRTDPVAALPAAEQRLFAAAAARALGVRPNPIAAPFGHLAGFPSPLTQRLEPATAPPVVRLLAATGDALPQAAHLAAEAHREARRQALAQRLDRELAEGAAPESWLVLLRQMHEVADGHRDAWIGPPATDPETVAAAVLRASLARDQLREAHAAFVAARSARTGGPGPHGSPSLPADASGPRTAQDRAADLRQLTRLLAAGRRVHQAERGLADLTGLPALPPRLRLADVAPYLLRRDALLAAADRWRQVQQEVAAASRQSPPGPHGGRVALCDEAAHAYRTLRANLADFAAERRFDPCLPPDLPRPAPLFAIAPAPVSTAPTAAPPSTALSPTPSGTARHAGRLPADVAIASQMADHHRAARRLASLHREAAPPDAASAAAHHRRLRSALGAQAAAEQALEARERRLERHLRRLTGAREHATAANLAPEPASDRRERGVAPALSRPRLDELLGHAARRLAAVREHRVHRDLTCVGAALTTRPTGADLGRAARLLQAAADARPLLPRRPPAALDAAQLAHARATFEAAAAALIAHPGAPAWQRFCAAGLDLHARQRRAALDQQAGNLRHARAAVRRACRTATATAPALGSGPPHAAALAARQLAAGRDLAAALANLAAAENALARRLDGHPATRRAGSPEALRGMLGQPQGGPGSHADLLARAGRGDLTPETLARLARDLQPRGAGAPHWADGADAPARQPTAGVPALPGEAVPPPRQRDGAAPVAAIDRGLAGAATELRSARAGLLLALRTARAAGREAEPARLAAACERYRAATQAIHQRVTAPILAARDVLPVASFLEHSRFRRAPAAATLAWAAHAARQGVSADLAAAWLGQSVAPLGPDHLSTRRLHLAADLGARHAAALRCGLRLAPPVPLP